MGWQEDLYGKAYKSQKTKAAAEKAKNTKEKRKQATYDNALTSQAKSYAAKHNIEYNDRLKNALNVAMTNRKRESDYNTLNQKHQEKWKAKTNRSGNESYHKVDEFEKKQYDRMRKEIGYSEKSGPISKATYSALTADYKARQQDGSISYTRGVQEQHKTENKKNPVKNLLKKTIGKADDAIHSKLAKTIYDLSGMKNKVELAKTAGKGAMKAVDKADQYGSSPLRNMMDTNLKDLKETQKYIDQQKAKGKDVHLKSQSAKDLKNFVKNETSDAWSGKRRASGEDVAKDLGIKNKYGVKAAGLGIEIGADPTNLIGAGVLKSGVKASLKGASKVNDIIKAAAKKPELTEATKSLLSRKNFTGKITNPKKSEVIEQVKATEMKKTNVHNEIEQMELIRKADKEQFVKENEKAIKEMQSFRENRLRQQIEKEMEFEGHTKMAEEYKNIRDAVGKRLNIPTGNHADFAAQLSKHMYSAKGKGKGDDIYRVAQDMGFESPDEFIKHYNNTYESHKIVSSGKQKFDRFHPDNDPDAVIDQLYNRSKNGYKINKDIDELTKRAQLEPKNDPDFMPIEPKNELDPTTAPLAKLERPLPDGPLPKGYDAEKHINEQISRGGKLEQKPSFFEKVKEGAARTYYNLFDDGYGMARVDKANGKNVNDHDSAVAMAHKARGSGEKSRQALEDGVYNSQGQKVGESLKEIIQRTPNPDKLENYLVAKSILDYDSKGMIAIKTDGISQKELSNATVKQILKDYPEAEEHAQAVYKFLDNQRDTLVEGGLLNKKQVEQMKKENPNYIPMERVRNEGIKNLRAGKAGLNKRYANVGDPTKKRTGSEKPVVSPFETMVKRQYVYDNMAERNKAGEVILSHLEGMDEFNPFGVVTKVEKNAGYKLAKKADELASATEDAIPDSINQMFYKADGKNNMVYVYRGGDKYHIQVKDKLLFDSMMAMDTKQLPTWLKAMNLPVRMLRAGVTLSPDFGARNVIRDQLTTGITSRAGGIGYVPFYDALHGAGEIIKGKFGIGNNALFHAYNRNGGNMSVLQNIDQQGIVKSYEDLRGNKPLGKKLVGLLKDPTKILEPLRKVGEWSEMSTRLGHMKRAVKNGQSIEQATYTARSTMDFNRAGKWGREYNQITAFFNAALQGMDVLARSVKDQPVKTVAKIGAYVVVPSVALYHLNKDQQWFKDMPEEERDRNWFIPAGDEIIKIPKPFEVGIMFGAGTERALDKYYNGEEGGDEFDGYLREVASAMTPEFIPTAVKPLLEVITNYNLFTHRAIESMGDKSLKTEDRYTPYNSQFAIRTSNILSKINKRNEVSPKDVDHLVRGYGGTLGTYATEFADGIESKFNPNIPSKPDRGLQTTPFIKSFFVKNLEGNNKQVDNFYELFQDLRDLKKREGDDFQYKEEKSYVEKTYKAISDLQGAKKSVLSDKKLSAKEKAKNIKDLNEQITNLSKDVNNSVKIKR